ncbi:uncharacterized protein LOC119367821 [Triticum dicoccoides]|uniref:uncharacterized protein LOC119367821 n=1 Tax=Triticum dicoccoides TaxID=85692 RepID=UPI00188F513A|nr:uncharacterized protein LOC119367821 [Triticum dicoccoides]XP_037489116.1 uncharacterized protein LOC119367821 [Triticum dicoccoides]
MSELMYMPTDLLWFLSYQIVAAAVTPVSRERAALRRLLLRRDAFPALTLWSSAGSVSLEGVCGLDRLLGVRPLRPSSSSCSEALMREWEPGVVPAPPQPASRDSAMRSGGANDARNNTAGIAFRGMASLAFCPRRCFSHQGHLCQYGFPA